jgi:type IV pilus assembly protein PilE
MKNKSAVYSRGFTLIEVMITVVIVGILTAVALPSYTEYIQRSHRSNARNTLIQASQWMERAATSLGTYPLTAAVPSGILAVEGARYTAAVASADGSTYTITATRATGTAQETDKCGDFVLDQANRRTNNNLATGMTAADCWGR